MVPGRSSLSWPNSIAVVGHISTIDQSGSKLRLAGWGYWAWRELYGCGAPAGVILWRCAAMIARRSFGASPRPPCQFQRRASTPAQASRLGIVTGRRRQPAAELDAGPSRPPVAPRAACKSQRDFVSQPKVGAPAPTLGHQSHNPYQPQRGCGHALCLCLASPPPPHSSQNAPQFPTNVGASLQHQRCGIIVEHPTQLKALAP